MTQAHDPTDIAAAASEAAAVLANATADAAAALARATARASAFVDEERNRKIDVMYDRSERIIKALFGEDERHGVVGDVSRLKSQMSFAKWAAGTTVAFTLSALGGVLLGVIHLS